MNGGGKHINGNHACMHLSCMCIKSHGHGHASSIFFSSAINHGERRRFEEVSRLVGSNNGVHSAVHPIPEENGGHLLVRDVYNLLLRVAWLVLLQSPPFSVAHTQHRWSSSSLCRKSLSIKVVHLSIPLLFSFPLIIISFCCNYYIRHSALHGVLDCRISWLVLVWCSFVFPFPLFA